VPLTGAAEADAGGLRARAATAERTGRPAEAILAYEELLRREPSAATALAPRLVELSIADGKAAAALSWAARVAPAQPEPRAYLAGVHARLGQWTEAELLLREAVRGASDPAQRVPILWQMAEAQAGGGRFADALATLGTAARAAGTNAALRTASESRADALRARPATAAVPGAKETTR
jgi:tetratricopeptide (TPR) repeat protein